MKPSKPYEEVQITPTLIWRWVREGDEYVMRISEMALEAHKAHIEAALAQGEQDKLLVDLIQEQRAEIDRLRQALAQPEQEELIQFKDGKWSYVRKPWVGLTDDDIAWADGHSHGNTTWTKQKAFSRAIEAKLKEKNCDIA